LYYSVLIHKIPKGHINVAVFLEIWDYMANERLIGVTRIASGWRIGLLKDVKDKLERDKLKLKIGDKIAYYENANGDIIIRKI